MNNPDNPPAFPSVAATHFIDGRASSETQHEGMSLLDYFAGQAVQGLLANRDVNIQETMWPDYATDAYRLALEMLSERQRALNTATILNPKMPTP